MAPLRSPLSAPTVARIVLSSLLPVLPLLPLLPLLSLLPLMACSASDEADSNAGSASSGAAGGSGAAQALDPRPAFAEAPRYELPSDTSSIASLAVDQSRARLYVATGSRVLVGDAGGSDLSLSPFVDLTAEGVSSISGLASIAGGSLAVFSSSEVVLISEQGQVLSHTSVTVPWPPSFFGAPQLTISRDGRVVFAVEAGVGSAGDGGAQAAHVARYDLPEMATKGAKLSPSETFAIGEPFHLVPAEVGGINAASPLASDDGSYLYVAHIVLRTVYRIDAAPPHAVTPVDLESLQRSATAMVLGSDGILVQAASFDQTVPVFRLQSPDKAAFLAEVPVGLTPQAVGSYGNRVIVAMSPGFGGLPSLPGGTGGAGGAGGMDFPGGFGGFPVGTGGFSGGAGGGPLGGGGLSGGAGATDQGEVAVRAFELRTP
jgi:hypothetical protein